MEAPSIMQKMEGMRQRKDRSYKHVFKGSVLVSTLMEHDKGKFINREVAVKFAQRMLDIGQIESIVSSKSFEDSVHLYRWRDESLVRDAKRMVSMTSHIPRKRLIELIDLQQGGDANDNNNNNAYHVRDVQDRIIAQAEQASDKTEKNVREVQAEKAVRSRERRRRRQTLDSTQLAESSSPLFTKPDGKNGEDSDSNLMRSSSISSETLSSTSLRVRPTSPSSEVRQSTSNTEVSETGKTEVRERRRERGDKGDVVKAKLREGVATPARVRSPAVTSSTVRVEDNIKSPVSVTSTEERVRPTIPAPTPEVSERIKSPTEAERVKSPVALRNTEERGRSPLTTRPSENTPGVRSPVTTKTDVSTDEEKKDKEAISTCRYDGVDMPALDLENYDMGRRRSKTTNKSLEELAEQSYSYSDNEKQLLEEIRKMQQEHETTVSAYEDKINELMCTMDDLRKLADELARSKSSIHKEKEDTASLLAAASHTVVAPPLHPPLPPPPPPPLMAQKVIKPTKPPIKPRVKMRPLFWNRIILDENAKNEAKKHKLFWLEATEPNFNVDEFERLFGKNAEAESAKTKSLHDTLRNAKGKGKNQAAKILEENRSRAVAIKLRSMHCQMEDIKQAVYKMDFSKIELDNLFSLFEIRGTPEELDKINQHIQANEDMPLDQPEQFLLELSQMSHFPERMECMIFRKRYNESLFNIDQQLTTVRNAIDEIKNSEQLGKVLEFILAFGNYMNGGTQRGQADGFDLNILPKLKDVKSMDNNMNLLQYIVRVYTREHEPEAGKGEATFKFPDASLINLASSVSFVDLEKQLLQLQHQLQTTRRMAELVCLDTEESLLQPFKDEMVDFFESADDMLKHQKDETTATRAKFQEFLQFMAIKDATAQVTPEFLFPLWYNFMEDYRKHWELEQKRFARIMFERVEQKRKARLQQAKRRKSNKDPDNLKQKLISRRRSDVSHTVKFLRSVSASAALDQETDDDRPRRRRRPHTDDMGETSDSNSRTVPDTKPRDPNKETMADRMNRRRAIHRTSTGEVPGLSRADSRESISSIASSTTSTPALNVIRRVRARHMSEDLRHLIPAMTEYEDSNDLRSRRRRQMEEERNLPDEAKGESRRRRQGRDETVDDDATSYRRRHADTNSTPSLSQTRGRYHSQDDILNPGRTSPSPPPRPNLPAAYTPRVRQQLLSDDSESTEMDPTQRQYREALRRFSRSRSNNASTDQLNGPMKAQRTPDSAPSPNVVQTRVRSRQSTDEPPSTISPFPDNPLRRRPSNDESLISRR